MHNAPQLAAHLRCRSLQQKAHYQKLSGQRRWAALAMTLVKLHCHTCNCGAASVGRHIAASSREWSTCMPQPEAASPRTGIIAIAGLRRPAHTMPRQLPRAAATACQSMPGRAAVRAASSCWRGLIRRQFGTSGPRQLAGAAGGSSPDNADGKLSERYGLKRSVRVSALLGENGLIRGAGVVRALFDHP